MTHDEFLSHLKARERATKDLADHWARSCNPDDTQEAVKRYWEAKGQSDAFGAMVSQFSVADKTEKPDHL